MIISELIMEHILKTIIHNDLKINDLDNILNYDKIVSVVMDRNPRIKAPSIIKFVENFVKKIIMNKVDKLKIENEMLKHSMFPGPDFIKAYLEEFGQIDEQFFVTYIDELKKYI